MACFRIHLAWAWVQNYLGGRFGCFGRQGDFVGKISLDFFVVQITIFILTWLLGSLFPEPDEMESLREERTLDISNIVWGQLNDSFPQAHSYLGRDSSKLGGSWKIEFPVLVGHELFVTSDGNCWALFRGAKSRLYSSKHKGLLMFRKGLVEIMEEFQAVITEASRVFSLVTDYYVSGAEAWNSRGPYREICV